ncbi:hypothetical protein [Alloactinosynnema sp. L-07]|uniref:hypothetical protein n=1 Tax=Alloactinosynnema sp. L-07 TaxID=1653480 RepID=UPI0012F8F253|nr:hypothetical protein [Alloactinosynnema sp. L-07]
MLGLVKAFLKAGILSQDRQFRNTETGTPQGGILSPLLVLGISDTIVANPNLASEAFS